MFGLDNPSFQLDAKVRVGEDIRVKDRNHMPQIEVNDEQILRCLDQLSPKARRIALAKVDRLT